MSNEEDVDSNKALVVGNLLPDEKSCRVCRGEYPFNTRVLLRTATSTIGGSRVLARTTSTRFEFLVYSICFQHAEIKMCCLPLFVD